jgi:DNA invertase Pin-like site-specific DNA recombinase
MSTDGPRLIGYRRVSTQMQGKSGLGLEAQEHAIASYCAMVKGQLLQTYTEVETGKKDTIENRPQLMNALSHARRTRATLVIAKLDRLSRSVYVTATLHRSNVDFVCCDNPTANRLTIQILAAVAEDESRRTSVRVRESLAEYKAGRRISARVRLLYPDGVPADVAEATAGKLGSALPECRDNLSHEARKKGAKSAGVRAGQLADEAYTDLAPMMIAWRAEGLSQRAISDRLNAAGHTTRRGRPWNQVQVLRCLRRFPA